MSESSPITENITVELRILDRQEAGYSIELTLLETQQIFRGRLSADILPWSTSGDSRVDGQSLFNALFTSVDLLKGWGVAQGRSARRRFQMRIDSPELHALPWELLRDGNDLLAADADTPFSRYLPVSREWGQAITARPVRVLAVISNPIDLAAKYDLSPADVELETRVLKEAIGSAAQLTFLDAPVTLERLEAELRKGYHLLHFVGHGVYNDKKQQAALYFQDATGNAQRVLDDDFSGMLNRLAAPPHVVVLAACQSAKQSLGEVFTGLGPELVQIGVPAVIAMQENVTVLTARQFAATFYQRVLDHGTIDLAMNEARSTLITQGRYDAAVPVLFMRLPDGRLWKAEDLTKQQSETERLSVTKKVYNRSGGVNIGGNARIGGDVTGRDKKTTTTNINTGGGAYVGGNVNVSGGKFVGRDDKSSTGWTAKDVENFFQSIDQQIDAKRDLAPQDQADLKADVKDLQAEVAKGEEADETFLERRLRSIKRMAPDILETIAATLAGPQAGLALVIRKVMEKARA